MMARATTDPSQPRGAFTALDGEACYCISSYHRMPPFLMSIASDSDLWMFVSSAGGLTAGRVDPDGSLFPYETVDKLHDAQHHTGPITVVRVRRQGQPDVLWEPFSERSAEGSRIERHLYKNAIGNRVVFEEIHHDLGLAFRYRWTGSDALGFVRTATLTNRGSKAAAVVVLDGLRNLLPAGVPLALQQQSSCLVDAYKRSECDPETRLGIFALTSKIVDQAEPAEELRATSVWCHGLARFDVSLSIDAVAAFRRAEPIPQGPVLTGRRGNYLVIAPLELEPGGHATWHQVADVGRSHVQIAALRHRLLEPGDLGREIDRSLEKASEGLLRIVASADGVQLAGDDKTTVHHFANVLFNCMRGGVFAKNYEVSAADFVEFLRTRNRPVAERHAKRLATLPDPIVTSDLLVAAQATRDADLERLAYEYLPLWFGRRHGDPSRPWNRFSIHVRNPDGSRALRYQGNWRDIFQNWEALSLGFPGFLPSFIAKFVNASTVDGFNPYRITRDGVDWEVADPRDPWSYIGYWGDHQIVYLLRLLEALSRFSPGTLEGLLRRDIFCYADVPYRLAPYEKIVENPRKTIAFDTEAASRIADRVRASGSDGKLVADRKGSVHHVNLLEKLLVPALSKLSNFVPDAGIWMNTQRPEWNDANNALAGHGVSMVTLCDLRRYLCFFEKLAGGLGDAQVPISSEVVAWFRKLRAILAAERRLLDSDAVADADCRRLVDALGRAFSQYRERVYTSGFSGKEPLPAADIAGLCREALAYLDHAIRTNRRDDGLYHTYNILDLACPEAAVVRRLHEMLEGQVAVLSSGAVGAAEAVRLVARLFESRLYREDQRSFLLYPALELPGFLDKNAIPRASVEAVPLLKNLLRSGDTSILEQDAFGVCRFHPDFRNALDLGAALDRLAERVEWAGQVGRERRAVLDVFEAVFHHHAFTGRSGRMYAYEGIGSVYWHMVAKLLLAVQEIALRAIAARQPAPVVEALAQSYYRIRSGLGFEKTVAEFGAFPTDPYSHTPAHGGAQQPGMTGLVKELILARFGELGVEVRDGEVTFRPALLRPSEFRSAPGTFRSYDLGGRPVAIELPVGSLAFGFCQVPVIYQRSGEEAWIRITDAEGRSSTAAGDRLDATRSRALFDRLGSISRIDVGVPDSALCRF